ncbi:MAG: hypothetical protein ACRDQB_03445 [Thermocrispum sp.]
MNTRRRLAAACLLLAALTPVAACGHNAAGDPAGGAASATAPGSGPPASAGNTTPAFGRPFTYPSGLAVTVSRPRTFTPSGTASPPFEYGVSFEITVTNGTERPYDLSRLTLDAAVNGNPAGEEIVDSTQGYPGLATAGSELPPARTVTLLLAFGSREWPSEATLLVRSGPKERTSAEFSGPVNG